jgi:hypothetical protein
VKVDALEQNLVEWIDKYVAEQLKEVDDKTTGDERVRYDEFGYEPCLELAKRNHIQFLPSLNLFFYYL